jgi:small subunit ribosomal protein S15
MLDKAAKVKLIKKFQTHDGDTGSPQVQIAILTHEIRELVDHLKTHKKDFSSRRGLLKKVSERRKLLKYLAREDAVSHDAIAKKLKIKAKSAVQASAEDEDEAVAARAKKV